MHRILPCAAALVAIGLTNCSHDDGSRPADLAAAAAPGDGGDRNGGGGDHDAGSSNDGGDNTDDACPALMARVSLADAGAVCVDRYEAATAVVDGNGATTPHPYDQPVDGVAKGSTIVAVVADGVKPQGYISEAQAAAACSAAHKRLCTLPEWLAACQGPQGWTYPYGNSYQAGACNEGRATNPVNDCFGAGDAVFTSANMNSSCCDDQPNTVAAGGSFPRCVSSWGIYDLHGNLHEWIDASSGGANGIFKGGYFVDAKINGPGCLYATTAHAKTYHDYSTGFRCCADAAR